MGPKQAKITISNAVCLQLNLHLQLIILIILLKRVLEHDFNTIRKLTEQHVTKNSSINITKREETESFHKVRNPSSPKKTNLDRFFISLF